MCPEKIEFDRVFNVKRLEKRRNTFRKRPCTQWWLISRWTKTWREKKLAKSKNKVRLLTSSSWTDLERWTFFLKMYYLSLHRSLQVPKTCVCWLRSMQWHQWTMDNFWLAICKYTWWNYSHINCLQFHHYSKLCYDFWDMIRAYLHAWGRYGYDA